MKSNEQSGFSLIEILIVVGMVGVLLSIILPIITNSESRNTGHQGYANESLDLFVQRMNYDRSTFRCLGDSDRDGYASCDGASHSGESVSIQCATGLNGTYGIKGCTPSVRVVEK